MAPYQVYFALHLQPHIFQLRNANCITYSKRQSSWILEMHTGNMWNTKFLTNQNQQKCGSEFPPVTKKMLSNFKLWNTDDGLLMFLRWSNSEHPLVFCTRKLRTLSFPTWTQRIHGAQAPSAVCTSSWVLYLNVLITQQRQTWHKQMLAVIKNQSGRLPKVSRSQTDKEQWRTKQHINSLYHRTRPLYLTKKNVVLTY